MLAASAPGRAALHPARGHSLHFASPSAGRPLRATRVSKRMDVALLNILSAFPKPSRKVAAPSPRWSEAPTELPPREGEAPPNPDSLNSPQAPCFSGAEQVCQRKTRIRTPPTAKAAAEMPARTICRRCIADASRYCLKSREPERRDIVAKTTAWTAKLMPQPLPPFSKCLPSLCDISVTTTHRSEVPTLGG